MACVLCVTFLVLRLLGLLLDHEGSDDREGGGRGGGGARLQDGGGGAALRTVRQIVI